MERLERADLLADADELDRRLGHVEDRQRRAAACVAVHLGKDYARDAEASVECLRDARGLLPRHRIRDEEDILRLRDGLDALELDHQLVVDLQPPRRVDDDRGEPEPRRLGDAALRDPDGVLAGLGVDAQVDLPAERLELRDGSRTIHVGGDEQRPPPLLLQAQGHLRGMGRLPGALQPDEHDHRRRRVGELQPGSRSAHQRHELVVNDLDDGLRRRQRREHAGADGLLLDPRDERLRDGQIDVGLQQRDAHLAHHVVDVGLR